MDDRHVEKCPVFNIVWKNAAENYGFVNKENLLRILQKDIATLIRSELLGRLAKALKVVKKLVTKTRFEQP